MPICVFSIQHTGTWFACEFLLSLPHTFGKHREHVFEWWKLANGEQRLPFQALAGNRPIIHAHLGHPGGVSIELACNLSKYWPAIVPLRDPLLALITRQIRHPDLNHTYLVDAFQELYRLDGAVRWLPVDLDQSHDERAECLTAIIADHPEISVTAMSLAHKAANEWQPPAYNITPPDHPLKLAYYSGDLGTIHAAMPEEFDALCAAERPIRDLLEPLGYNCPWWT